MTYQKRLIAGLAAALLFVGGCSNSQPSESKAEEQTKESSSPVIEQVENKEMTLPIQNWNDDYTELKAEETRDGKYTGQLVDGVPRSRRDKMVLRR